jgi:hypothetical protein
MRPGEFVADVGGLGMPTLNNTIYCYRCVEGEHTALVSSFDHAIDVHKEAPVGIARIAEEGGRLIARGRFHLETEAGLAACQKVAALGDKCRWSISFNIQECRRVNGLTELYKILVWELSPCLEGAASGTRTLALGALQVAA